MRYQIKTVVQVVEFTRNLPPETRSRCKKALKSLAHWEGDIVPLDNALAGFHRLRVGNYRFIFAVRSGKIIDVVFVQERNLVYVLFESMIQAGEIDPLT